MATKPTRLRSGLGSSAYRRRDGLQGGGVIGVAEGDGLCWGRGRRATLSRVGTSDGSP